MRAKIPESSRSDSPSILDSAPYVMFMARGISHIDLTPDFRSVFMAVFENLRNFIRQGRQAADNLSKPSRSHAHQDTHQPAPSRSQPVSQSAPQSNSVSDTQNNKDERKKRYDDNIVKQLVDEEKASAGRLPNYPGLERYQLLDKMGDGAFSVVYRARDQYTGEPRAIKVVYKEDLSPSQKSSVLKEAAIMRQLDNRHIVKMFAFLETQKHYFIILELIPGGELFHEIVRLTYFSEDLSRHVIIQVAEAVRYLHEEAGVVHRDIKPENLLFTPSRYIPSEHRILRKGDDESKEDEGRFIPSVGAGGIGKIKLADFGLSKVIWDQKTMTPCGTVGYTAPEIVKDERYSKSVDMWALGCVLYTMLCGFPPFYDESIEILTHKVAKGQYTFLSPWWDDISDSAKDLVSKLLTVDPEKRYTIDEFLQHPWITQAPQPTPETLVANESISEEEYLQWRKSGKAPRDEQLSGALKEAFDVSNAVYRMEQEQAHANNPFRTTVPIMEEEEEDEYSLSHVENAVASLDLTPEPSNSRHSTPGTTRGRGHESPRRAPNSQTQVRKAQPAYFDLHLEGATLLERRRQNKAPAIA